MSCELHLVRLSVPSDRLIGFARRSDAMGPQCDLGYATHALLAALFDPGVAPEDRVAPKPFAILDATHRTLDILGYSRVSHEVLRERASRFSDPLTAGVCDITSIVSRPMPTSFAAGTRLGFTVRVCPTRRVKKRGPMTRDRAEMDAFMARAWAVPKETPLDREAIYREWLTEQLGRDGAASLEEAQMTQYQRDRLLRRTQGESRRHQTPERPNATFTGVLKVEESEAFARLLARGVGRHRSFGFGMLLLRPAPLR